MILLLCDVAELSYVEAAPKDAGGKDVEMANQGLLSIWINSYLISYYIF